MSEYEFHHLGCGCGCNDYLRNPKDAEIVRLKKVISLDAVAIGNKNRIITELCDALEEVEGAAWQQRFGKLIQHARKATIIK
jgi:hypothetical protein